MGFGEGLAAVKLGGRWGFMDTDGEVVIPARFALAGTFSQGRASVQLAGRPGRDGNAGGPKWGYLDRAGELVIPASFDDARRFSEGLAAVALDGRWGCTDRAGAMVVEPAYVEIRPFNNGLARVAVVDKVADPDASRPGVVVRDRWWRSDGEGNFVRRRYGFIDRTGALVIAPRFAAVADRFSCGFAVAAVLDPVGEGRNCYINTTGKEAFGRRFYRAWMFSEGLAVVKMKRGYPEGYIDTTGKVAVPFRFGGARRFSEGLAPVNVGGYREWGSGFVLGGKWGYIDKQGQFVIEPSFDGACPFSEGLGRVFVGQRAEGEWPSGSKWGFIDREGKFVVRPRFIRALDFQDGLAEVETETLRGYVDRKGRLVHSVEKE